MQFHPTALTTPGAPRFLISEAVRGEGAHLVDDRGYRFAFDYHPAGELAPRDVVSQAIFSHLQKHSPDPATGCVWLDLSPIPAEKIRHRFPNIINVCKHWGIDILTELIPVAPAAHYWMGGVYTDLTTQTSIPGVYAVGETTSTGVHGANRLASNSLLECVVFGAQLGKISIEPRSIEPISIAAPASTLWAESLVSTIDSDRARILAIRQELPRLMWQAAGICRDRDNLDRAIIQIELWQTEFDVLAMSRAITQLAPPQAQALPTGLEERDLQTWGETRNLLDIGRSILTGAAMRTESRGGHYRTDFPAIDPDWQVHTLVNGDLWSKSAPIRS